MLDNFKRVSSDGLLPSNPLYKCVEQGDLEMLALHIQKSYQRGQLVKHYSQMLNLARQQGHDNIADFILELPEVVAALNVERAQKAKLNDILRSKQQPK